MNRVKRTGTGRPAQPPPYFGTRQQDKAECTASALGVTASAISTRKFQKNSGVFPEICIIIIIIIIIIYFRQYIYIHTYMYSVSI